MNVANESLHVRHKSRHVIGFGRLDDINEMMNSKSNYPMVFFIIIKAIEDLSDDEKDDFYIHSHILDISDFPVYQ